MDKEFLDKHFETHEAEAIAGALGILARYSAFEIYGRELTAQLAVGDPDESEQTLLDTLRDIRRQVQILTNLHHVGLEHLKGQK